MRKKEIMFIITGVLLLLVVVGFVVYSVNFLVNHVKSVLEIDQSSKTETIKFDLEGLKKLGLTE